MDESRLTMMRLTHASMARLTPCDIVVPKLLTIQRMKKTRTSTMFHKSDNVRALGRKTLGKNCLTIQSMGIAVNSNVPQVKV